jgi:hypothetical protein
VNTVGQKGGNGAYSLASDSARITMIPVNDAPTLTATGPVLPSVSRSASAASIDGVLVSSLLGGVKDPDGVGKGIAVFSLSGKIHGSWQFSLNDGATWTPIGDPSESAARLLAPSNKIRFVPNVNYGVTVKLYFRAWDQTDNLTPGSIASTVNKKGGSNPYSIGTDAATLLVT